jgi:hypothetical protein
MLVSQLGKPTQTLYTPSTVPKTNITFRPVKQSKGNVHYVAFVESEGTVIIEDSDARKTGADPDNDPDDDSSDDDSDDDSDELYKKGEIYSPLATSESANQIFSLGDDPIKSFYIGSVTVVGLFILYRMLIKK